MPKILLAGGLPVSRRTLLKAAGAGAALSSIAASGAGAGSALADAGAASVAGGAIRPAIEASSPDAIIELVYSGMGVGILSESIAAADDRVVGVPIRDVDATAHLGLLWRSRTSAAATRSVDIARDAFAVGD